MNINLDMKQRTTAAELLRREAATLRVLISAKSGDAPRELVEHAIFLSATADSPMTSFEPEKAATIVLKED
jgi:hypothetical protein